MAITELSTLSPETRQAIEQYVNQRVNGEIQRIENQILEKLKPTLVNKRGLTILLSSNDFDRVLPAFIIATGAASFGMESTIFATMWGITTLRKRTIYRGKKITEKMLTMMLPSSVDALTLSKLNMMGVGAAMMKGMLKQNNVSSLPELMELASEMGVNLMACQMTMGIMGITKEELRNDLTYGGVAAFIEKAEQSSISLYI